MTAGDSIRAAPGAVGFSVNQTSFMFGAVLFAFLFFITVRGDLAAWLGLLGLAGGAASTPAPVAPAVPANGVLPSLPALGGAGAS